MSSSDEILVNAYCTLRDPPPPDFPHKLNSRRDRSDPELLPHLRGFVGYVLRAGGGKMTQPLFHVIAHIERVQHQLSFWVDEKDWEACKRWGWRANALCFLPDGTVRDPSGSVLVAQQGGAPEPDARLPHPQDARDRKAASERKLDELGVATMRGLPPVVSELEFCLRPAEEVARRALALFVVAVRAESLAHGPEPIPLSELRDRLPVAFEALSRAEHAFLYQEAPERQAIANALWRYEALFLLQWALGWAEELPLPTAICDVPRTARRVVGARAEELVAAARLRPVADLLDALDLHLRLHWAARQARLDGKAAPTGLDEGVIQERRQALNWLVRYQDADWDDVDTPT
jgi:hypothetical protein